MVLGHCCYVQLLILFHEDEELRKGAEVLASDVQTIFRTKIFINSLKLIGYRYLS